MFRFTAQGRIGRIDQPKNDASVVRLSIADERLVEGPEKTWTKTEWLNAVCFDRTLNERLITDLEVGQTVTLDGRIETRRRQIGERKITDFSFVITRFERLSRPKANGKPKPQPEASA